MIKTIKKWIKGVSAAAIPNGKVIRHLQDTHIKRADFGRPALDVVERLEKAGYEAYIVGGGVRDLLLNKNPKDFDVATSARPEEVKRLFGRSCRLIGRRFRLAHVGYGKQMIEVATFRGEGTKGRMVNDAGRLERDNVFGNHEEDAFRRDFTINALYYEPRHHQVVDLVGGLKDLDKGIIRFIGDSEQRIKEDPVRMARAVRFQAKLGFALEKSIEKGIAQFHHLLDDIPPARRFDELFKALHSGQGLAQFHALERYGLLGYFLPFTQEALRQRPECRALIEKALVNTDERLAEGKSVNPAFILAVMLYQPYLAWKAGLVEDRHFPPGPAGDAAARDVLFKQQASLAIPKRFTQGIQEIWQLQWRLENPRSPQQVEALLTHERFRAAYDFLGLRAQTQEPQLQNAFDYWTQIQLQDEGGRQRMMQQGFVAATDSPAPRPKRRRRKPNNRSARPNPSYLED